MTPPRSGAVSRTTINGRRSRDGCHVGDGLLPARASASTNMAGRASMVPLLSSGKHPGIAAARASVVRKAHAARLVPT